MLVEGRDSPKVTKASHLQSWDANQAYCTGLVCLPLQNITPNLKIRQKEKSLSSQCGHRPTVTVSAGHALTQLAPHGLCGVTCYLVDLGPGGRITPKVMALVP